MLQAMTPGALLTRSRLCTFWRARAASCASPQPKSATVRALLWSRKYCAATSTGCTGHLAVCCWKPCPTQILDQKVLTQEEITAKNKHSERTSATFTDSSQQRKHNTCFAWHVGHE